MEDGAFVSVGGLSTNSGMLVADADLVIGYGAVTVEDTLYLGQGAADGSATIRTNGLLDVGNLVIEDGSTLDLLAGGTFAIQTNFNVADWATNGFNWGEGATLAVGGVLSGMAKFLFAFDLVEKEDNCPIL